MRISIVLSIIALIWLHYSLWFGHNNLFDYYRVKRQIVQQQLQNAELIRQNQRIWAEVHALSYGGETLEELARSKLNMIKPGEIFYFIPIQGDNRNDRHYILQ